MHLVKPQRKYENSFRAGLAEFDTDSGRDAWIYLGPDCKDFFELSFSRYTERLIKYEIEPPPHFVCGSTYWAVEGEEVVGRIGLRHELNDFLKNFGGHIGYVVRPRWRRQGVATEMVRLILETERAKSIGSLLFTCDEGNIGSEKTIIKNGGTLENIILNKPGGPRKKRFWINI